MISWIAIQVGAFTLVQTKLPSYVTPCYPALAILTATCLDCLATKKIAISRGWFYAAFAGLGIAGLAICGGLGFATSKFMPDQFWLTAIGLVPLIASGILIFQLSKNGEQRLPGTLAFSSVIFCWLLFGFGTVSVDKEQQSHFVLGDLKQQSQAIGSFGCLESSWVFYSGHPIRELNTDIKHEPENRASTSSLKERKYWMPQDTQSVGSFLNLNPNALILTSSDHLDELKNRLPEDYKILRTADYFLKNKKLYLLGIESKIAAKNRKLY